MKCDRGSTQLNACARRLFRRTTLPSQLNDDSSVAPIHSFGVTSSTDGPDGRKPHTITPRSRTCILKFSSLPRRMHRIARIVRTPCVSTEPLIQLVCCMHPSSNAAQTFAVMVTQISAFTISTECIHICRVRTLDGKTGPRMTLSSRAGRR